MRRSIAALLALSLLTACGTTARQDAATSLASSPSGAAPDGGTFLSVPLPDGIRTLPLVDAAGHTFALSSLRGKYVVIANFMTTCQDICPMTSANLRRIGDAIQADGLADRVVVVGVSIDAERDTPARMAAYQRLFGRDATWTLATGTAADLEMFWTFFGAPAKRVDIGAAEMASHPRDWQTGAVVTYDMTHADLVLVLDDEGVWRWLDLGAPQTSDGKIPARLRRFLTDDGLAALAAPEQPTWTADAVLSAVSMLRGNAVAL